MTGFIGEDQVRRIKEATDLVQLMGDYTSLKRSGANFAGCCAFHQERTPSMHVYADQQTYHCFGCGVHGDVITLIREKEHLDFSGAIELLARRAGIEIIYQHGGPQAGARGEREQLVRAMELTTLFYERMLWESPEGGAARTYLAGRGLTEVVCRRFRLGWSPGRGTLVEEARRSHLDPALLVLADLAHDRNGRLSDRFYERVMFPICDRFGAPIAFSARLLPEAERRAKEEGKGVGKYINTTDTPLYHKSRTIFNLHRARSHFRERNRILVMEGPTDVIAADQAGIGECVAVLGTAFTADHARQLGTLTSSGALVLVLDGDQAGQTNSLKAVRTCLAVGVPCRVAVIPDQMDPAELLHEDAAGGGATTFEAVIAASRGEMDHLLRSLAPRPYELEPRRRLALADEVLTHLRALADPDLAACHVRDIATYLNVDVAVLQRRLATMGVAPGTAREAADGDGPAAGPLAGDLECILHILIQRRDLRDQAFDTLGLEPSQFPSPWGLVAERLVDRPDADSDDLLLWDALEPHPAVRDAIVGWLSKPLDQRTPALGEPAQHLAEAVRGLRLRRLRDESHRLGLAMAEAERMGDLSRLTILNQERLALVRTIRDVGGQSGLAG